MFFEAALADRVLQEEFKGFWVQDGTFSFEFKLFENHPAQMVAGMCSHDQFFVCLFVFSLSFNKSP